MSLSAMDAQPGNIRRPDTIEPVTITAAADGSALGNPGPAGWGWYIDDERWAVGGWPHGTNNQGELTAVLDLLRQTAGLDEDLMILCDSQYVIKSVTEWMPGWKKRGWRKADGKPVLNALIMQALDSEMAAARQAGRRITFRWVKGHAGHALNEQADRLANGAASAYARGEIPDPGPGIAGAARYDDPLPAASNPTAMRDGQSPRGASYLKPPPIDDTLF